MSILRWIVNDVESLVPSFGFNEQIKSTPAVGEQAPPSPLLLPDGKNIVLLFTRHMGCPEIKSLIGLAKQKQSLDLQFIIITHSVPTSELEDFVIKELEQDVPDNVTIHGDAERKVYMAYGLGELGWGDVINANIMKQVGDLKKEGIANRLTRGTRWQTNGGFAIDKQGKIRYAHVGKDSGDMMNLDAAIQSVS